MQQIAIIGSGPTGIYTAHHLLKQGTHLSITMFESQSEAGKGTPYHQDWNDKEMLSNIASIEIPPVEQTLVEWLNLQTDEALSLMGVDRAEIDERTFFPRVVLDNYFHRQLSLLQESAEAKGNRLVVKTRHKVLDAEVMKDGITLVVRNETGVRETSVFDDVVMATGHAWPKETEMHPGYFLSPWPASSLQTIGNCHVGIRGTSLSGIDAVVALAVARGHFVREENGALIYHAESGTEDFQMTMLSRKGVLPEADFYCPIPYAPLRICTPEAIATLIADNARGPLLEKVFALFKAEIRACDPAYAAQIGLDEQTLESFSKVYFAEREEHEPFAWAKKNLAEAKHNQEHQHTVAWRYAILRMHEVVKEIVPHLLAEEHAAFNRYFKHVFVDDYATVPHESIERLLALHAVGKLSILRVGDDYHLHTNVHNGAILTVGEQVIHFPAFIEAMGQRSLSAREFPFPTLWRQGVVNDATASDYVYSKLGQRIRKKVDIGGIALDEHYHPVSDLPNVERLYCLSLPFMLSQFPFAQGITSSHEMGTAVAEDILKNAALEKTQSLVSFASQQPMMVAV